MSGDACVWDWGAQRKLISIPCPEGTLATLGGEGEWLIIASKRDIRVWNVATGRESWSSPERVAGLGITPDRRWMVVRVSSCSEWFKWLPIDPWRETSTLVCRQLTPEECGQYDVEGDARERAAQFASKRTTIELR
jgi:hypothetical protein